LFSFNLSSRIRSSSSLGIVLAKIVPCATVVGAGGTEVSSELDDVESDVLLGEAVFRLGGDGGGRTVLATTVEAGFCRALRAGLGDAPSAGAR